MKLLCAWCPTPKDEPVPDEDTSHSICEEHEEQLLIQSSQRQFDKVPSYVGERQKFEQYIEKRKL